MDTNKRILAASAAAVAGLFLAGCDNTEEPPETVPENELAESEMGSDAGGAGESAAEDEATTADDPGGTETESEAVY